MKTYHKIQSIFKRDMANNGKIMEDKFALPETDNAQLHIDLIENLHKLFDIAKRKDRKKIT